MNEPYTPHNNKTPEATEAREDADSIAVKKKKSDDLKAARLEIKAKRAIERRLNDPKSFEWVGVGYTENDDLGFVIFGSFRAKNALGGYVVTRFIYNGQTLLVEGDGSRFEEAWSLI